MNIHNKTPYLAGSETSRASALELDRSGRAAGQKKDALAYIRSKAKRGATADECTVHMQENGHPKIYNGSVAAALAGLEKSGHIIKTAIKRKTRSNRCAVVYIAQQYKGLFTADELNIRGKQRDLAAANDKYKKAIINALARFDLTGYESHHYGTVEILRKAIDN